MHEYRPILDGLQSRIRAAEARLEQLRQIKALTSDVMAGYYRSSHVSQAEALDLYAQIREEERAVLERIDSDHVAIDCLGGQPRGEVVEFPTHWARRRK